jgi:hypothetical protein
MIAEQISSKRLRDRERMRLYRKEQPEKVKLARKKWQQKNPEIANTISKNWRSQNRDYYARHREEMAFSNARYRIRKGIMPKIDSTSKVFTDAQKKQRAEYLAEWRKNNPEKHAENRKKEKAQKRRDQVPKMSPDQAAEIARDHEALRAYFRGGN